MPASGQALWQGAQGSGGVDRTGLHPMGHQAGGVVGPLGVHGAAQGEAAAQVGSMHAETWGSASGSLQYSDSAVSNPKP